MSDSPFAIGIDLGTTHSAISFVDVSASEGDAIQGRELPIPQSVAAGSVEERLLLPSFLYLPHASEFGEKDLALPWDGAPSSIVGEMARQVGAKTPIRLVSSAKSWLSHGAVDRRGPILPVDAPPEVERVSPFVASARYLEHLRATWDAKNPNAPLSRQEVVLTVPASFDPAARELTAAAAQKAGISNFVLLEEPQAALYSWIAGTRGNWRNEVKVGDVILVVDVGGGTTDLSLIAVAEEKGALVFHRIAVGDHILLGGDNMDLALAHLVRQKLELDGRMLDSWQLGMLTHACRSAKETLLDDTNATSAPIVVASRGSKLVGGSLRSELTREEVLRVVLDGFFPKEAVTAHPASRPRGALTQMGLPYAQDAAITRHLAAFLSRQAQATAGIDGFSAQNGAFLKPTALLFNGGVFKAKVLAARVVEVLNSWLASANATPVRVLEGADLDLAVARGAAYYGYVRRGRGVRIRGGSARAYYIGIETAAPAVPGMPPPLNALCVAPFGMEEGTSSELPPTELGLVVGEPVRFRFFESSVRRDDRAGTLLERWRDDEIHELREIEATLPAEGRAAGEVVPVRLSATITEVGTLLLEALPRQGTDRWKVELDVRGASAA